MQQRRLQMVIAARNLASFIAISGLVLLVALIQREVEVLKERVSTLESATQTAARHRRLTIKELDQLARTLEANSEADFAQFRAFGVPEQEAK